MIPIDQPDLNMTSDEELYKQMCKHPSAVVLHSNVPTSQGRQKQFKYLYVPQEKYKLGEGSFGQVFVCFYESQGKNIKLALKIIRIPENYDQIKTIQHIVSTSRQQVLALIKLRQNKHIIRIQDILRQNNMIFIVLEYCNERDLMHFFKQIKREKKITRQLHVRYFFSQILDAFKQLHKHNFMHRDIKPSNILVKNGVLKIADFGLSKQIFQGQSNIFEQHVGTMITAAPQIVFKQSYTNKCDIYSLGAILYWMIYDRFPFLRIPTRADFKQNKMQFPQQSQHFSVSNQMLTLLKEMLAQKQSDRIDWVPLLQHQLFKPQNFIEYEKQIQSYYQKIQRMKIRQTYGRNIADLLIDDQFLDTAIPSAYYKFLRQIEGEDKFNRFRKAQRNSILKDSAFIAHKTIKQEYRNQQIHLKLCRTILMDMQTLQIKSKQNKAQTIFMKQMLSYSIYKYLLYLMRKIKDQLVFIIPPTIFPIQMLKQARKQPLHQNFVKSVNQKLKGIEYMLRYSEEQVSKLQKKCQQYRLSNDLGVAFQQINESNLSSFMTVIDQCTIQLVYFLKPELAKTINTSLKSNDNSAKITKQIVMIIHHLFLFSMKDQILPTKYDPQFDYSNFLQAQTDPKKLKSIEDKITALVGRFQ